MDQDKKIGIGNRTGQNIEGAHANTPLQRLSSSTIVGDDVRNLQGEDLGTIKDLMVDLQNGCIEYAVLQFGGFIGIGSKYFAIPWKHLTPDPENKCFILNKDKEFLKNAPGFDKDHWPGTNSEYYNETTVYWGSARSTYRPEGGELL